ncbi:upper zone of growth plate and cartilage matrix associated a isoform X1 [Austrofundulus limnaeus]|uniref:Unique cartilage matrix-associated protein n=1 Tax=Austrofundulus limnaeus TaxID=52670 RepID=A0A2I4CNQ7_AUSLI|nr:PREDICTED: unique cartilage matrix-associated protein-like isoform X1 [Austrofundulus limnaeus]
MSWTRGLVLVLLSALLILTFSDVVKSAAVRDSEPADPKDAARQVFMHESDASNFFKRRSRRSPRYYAETLESEASRQRAAQGVQRGAEDRVRELRGGGSRRAKREVEGDKRAAEGISLRWSLPSTLLVPLSGAGTQR